MYTELFEKSKVRRAMVHWVETRSIGLKYLIAQVLLSSNLLYIVEICDVYYIHVLVSDS